MEGLFNVGDGALHIQHHTIWMCDGHLQTVGLGEIDQRVVVLFCGSEFLRELFRRQVMMIIGAPRIIELLKQCGECLLVA